MSNTITTSEYHHIDNGGPEINLVTTFNDEGIESTKMTFDASYYGYPSFSTTLDIYGGVDNIPILETYKKALSEHIAQLKMRIK